MTVPEEQQWLFWDVDIALIQLQRDRRYILARVLERGRMIDVRWAVSIYGLEGLREFFREGGHLELSRTTRSLWRAVFADDEGEQWQDSASWRKTSAAPGID